MTRQSGARAKSNGAEFEDYLDRVVFKAALDSGYFARIDKQNPTYVATRSRAGVTFKPRAASGADWIALGGPACQWEYIAIEAKHSDDPTLARSRIEPNQSRHLASVAGADQLAVILVSFSLNPGAAVFAMRWSESLFKKSGNGRSLSMADCPDSNRITHFRDLDEILGSWQRLA